MKKVYSILVIVLFTACSGVQNLYEKGNDEQVIKKVIQKESKQKAKLNDIRFLEQAFERQKSLYLNQLEDAQNSTQNSKWVNIHSLSKRFNTLQRNIENNLPIRAKNGYTAQFDFLEIDSIVEEARVNAFDYYIHTSKRLIKVAEENKTDKLSARRAYDMLRKASNLEDNSELRELTIRARELGITRVATQVGFNSTNWNVSYRPSRYDRDIDRELERMLAVDNSTWIERVYGPVSKENTDYILAIDIADSDFSRIREQTSNRNFSEQERERVRNQNGSLAVDSLGQPVYTYRTITARLESTIYEMDVDVEVDTRLIRISDNYLAFQRRYRGERTYREETCRIFGEERIVPNSIRCRNQSIEFPRDSELIEDVLQEMRSEVRNDLRRAVDRLN